MHGHPEHALDRLYADLYEDVRDLAERALRRENAGHTLQPTALAHEAYVRLSSQRRDDWRGRSYFLTAAAGVIRRLLVDHARGKRRIKRGQGWTRLQVAEIEQAEETLWDVVDLDSAITELEGLNPRHARVVQLKFFAGLNNREVAGALGVSTRTVNTDWSVARAWLRMRLGSAGSDSVRR